MHPTPPWANQFCQPDLFSLICSVILSKAKDLLLPLPGASYLEKQRDQSVQGTSRPCFCSCFSCLSFPFEESASVLAFCSCLCSFSCRCFSSLSFPSGKSAFHRPRVKPQRVGKGLYQITAYPEPPQIWDYIRAEHKPGGSRGIHAPEMTAGTKSGFSRGPLTPASIHT